MTTVPWTPAPWKDRGDDYIEGPLMLVASGYVTMTNPADERLILAAPELAAMVRLLIDTDATTEVVDEALALLARIGEVGREVDDE